MVKIYEIKYYLFLALFISCRSQKLPESLINYEIKDKETIQFMTAHQDSYQKIKGYSSRGSYDGTIYLIEYKGDGILNVYDVNGCKGSNQNELDLLFSSGSITQKGDTLKIDVNTLFNKLYLMKIELDGLVDSFDNKVQVILVSRTLTNDYCPNLLSTSIFTKVIALPKNVTPDEIYEAYHPENTIGVFKYFAIVGKNGNVNYYKEGDYILVGGNSLKYNK